MKLNSVRDKLNNIEYGKVVPIREYHDVPSTNYNLHFLRNSIYNRDHIVAFEVINKLARKVNRKLLSVSIFGIEN